MKFSSGLTQKRLNMLQVIRRLLVLDYDSSNAFAEGYRKGSADLLKAAEMIQRGDARMPVILDAVRSGRKKADPNSGRLTQIEGYPHQEPPREGVVPYEPVIMRAKPPSPSAGQPLAQER